MDKVIEVLENRRSCRQFEPTQLEPATLDQIVEAGLWAPSCMGEQATRLVVLQDKEQITRLSAMNARIEGTDDDPFYGAPTVIVVLAKADAPAGVEDGSLVMGNLMNAAAALAIGSCWIHRAREEFESDEGKALLKQWGVEGDWRGVGHCLLGYVGEDGLPKPAPRAEGRVTYVR